MSRLFTALGAGVFSLCLAAPLHAEMPTLAFGIGAHTSGANAEASLRYIGARRLGVLQPVYGLSLGARGVAYAGGGLAFTWRAPEGWFLRGSVMAGVHRRGNGRDLGGPVQFRSAAELGMARSADTDIGIGFDHRSHARIYGTNPGLNTAYIFVTHRFD